MMRKYLSAQTSRSPTKKPGTPSRLDNSGSDPKFAIIRGQSDYSNMIFEACFWRRLAGISFITSELLRVGR